MNRKDILHIGVRTNAGHNPWYLSISESTRREVQLPYHRKLRVRMSPHSDPIILPVENKWRSAAHNRDVLIPIRVKKNKQGIVLGPIIGILTVAKKNTDSFRGNRANFREITEMGKRLGLTVIVFTPDGVTSDDKVNGYVCTGRGRQAWKRVVLPFPSVVYNRVPDRESERSPEVVWMKRSLIERGIPVFNNSFFNKGQIHEWLSASDETVSYLPQTEELQGEEQISRLLRHYNLLYVKPVEGKAGEGIIQVRKEGRQYRLVFQRDGKRTSTLCSSRAEVAKAVARKTRGRHYLLQQGIYLATCNGRHFDLRLLTQKNRYGEWRVTGIGARLADEDGITTHVPNGGEIEQAMKALHTSFGTEKARAIFNQARNTALVFARVIEEEATKAGGAVGEMSMDIGVGVDGQLWFFEANAKPMKFDEPMIRAKSLLRFLHYCDFLARTR